MSRDKVKDGLAEAVRVAVRNTGNGLAHRLREYRVADVQTDRVTDLETQVKVLFEGMPPRYFLVKVSEKF